MWNSRVSSCHMRMGLLNPVNTALADFLDTAQTIISLSKPICIVILSLATKGFCCRDKWIHVCRRSEQHLAGGRCILAISSLHAAPLDSALFSSQLGMFLLLLTNFNSTCSVPEPCFLLCQSLVPLLLWLDKRQVSHILQGLRYPYKLQLG